jgi:hypothetical protein
MAGIESETEKYISPNDIAQILQVHHSAPVRWMKCGTLLCNGSRVYLKHLRLPGGFRTTQTWLDEFLRVVADDKVGTPDETPALKPTRSASTNPSRAKGAALRAAPNR